MRFLLLAFSLLFATPAFAQSELTLQANPLPVVNATINGHPVRLEVALWLGAGVVLSRETANRLGVHNVPFIAVRVLNDDDSVTGRIARPQIQFEGGRTTRAWTGVFPVPVTRTADGVIGAGALPYDAVTIVLGPERPGRDIVFPLEHGESWQFRSQIGGISSKLAFDLDVTETILNRTLAHLLDAQGAIPTNGDLTPRPVLLGLTSMMQPVRSSLDLQGMPLGPVFARTGAPLLGADDPDAIAVHTQAQVPPGARIGRAALSSCSSIRVVQATRQIVLHCAVPPEATN